MSLPSSSTRRPSFPPHSSEHDALEVGLLFVSGIGDGDDDDAMMMTTFVRILKRIHHVAAMIWSGNC